MGVAAININGYTMNSLLDIPINLNDAGGSSKHFKPWDPDKLEQFKKMYDLENASVIILDEVSMVKPWMLAYLDERMKEATQVFDKPFGGISLVMFGDFDQQSPIGGSSLPHFAMRLVEKEYQHKFKIFFTNRTKEETVEINSTLCRSGVRLFETAHLLRLTSQHRCTKDPEHMANLNKMNSGSKMTSEDFNLYKTFSSDDLKNLDDFLMSTVIVTGNYERQEINSFMLGLWAKQYNTHIVRWKRKMKYDKWRGRPRTNEALLNAEQQSCFYEQFTPMAPAYLTNNLNVHNDLANGTLVRLHSLAFDDPADKTLLDELIASTPPGENIDLPYPPTAINVELYPDFPDDNEELQQCKQRKRELWTHGSITNDGHIVIPIDRKTGKYHTESIRAANSSFYYNASSVPIADHFPIELGFCITIPKAQGRTIHKLIASLSRHPLSYLRFNWEQIYVLLSRITGRSDLRLLLKMGNRSTLDYISELEKDPYTVHYFKGFGDSSNNSTPLRWNKAIAARAAGFVN